MEKYKNKKQYRYKDYDYSQDGLYFVTICTKDRELFFGEVKNKKMELSEVGHLAENFWQEITDHFSFVKLHEFIIMPNHIHGIIEIAKRTVGTGQCPVPTVITGGSKFGHVTPKSLSTIVGSYKSIVTKTINVQIPSVGFAWQDRFHDHIIRNDDELDRISQYVINNPAEWETDKNNENDNFSGFTMC